MSRQQAIVVGGGGHGAGVFSRFPETMGRDIGYVNNGLVFLATREEEGALRRCVEQQRRLGVDASLVDPAGLKTLHPDLVVDDVSLASFERDAGHADPYSVTVGY